MMRRFLLLASCCFALAACSQTSAAAPSTTTATTTTTTEAATPTTVDYPTEVEPAPDVRPVFGGLGVDTLADGMTLVAKAAGETEVYEVPGAEEPWITLAETTIVGTPTVLSIVEGPTDGWAKVMLPVRPNGTLGWVKTQGMLLYVVDGRVVVNLSNKTLTYYQQGEVVLETTVAIGSDRNPTPTGSLFITDNVTLADPSSPWGPYAFGLSARSDTITEYNGGDGIIGIHGTNRPNSIGSAASLGCLRIDNDVITQLHEMIPIGTPVEIMA